MSRRHSVSASLSRHSRSAVPRLLSTIAFGDRLSVSGLDVVDPCLHEKGLEPDVIALEAQGRVELRPGLRVDSAP